jgi:hypothetical protein
MMTFIRAARTAAALMLSLAAATTAIASEAGQIAADQVDRDSYIEFLDVYLFTHEGDNRGPSGEDLEPCRDNIAALFESYGLQVDIEPFWYLNRWYHNVVGTKVGVSEPDKQIIIGAHYDSVSNPGADDNASGVALVLEAARILGQYDSDYTIKFIAFSMEEKGLVGSEAYVDAHIGDDIVAMISADMVAFTLGGESARVYSRGGALMNSIGAAVNEYGDGLSWFDAGWISASDHAPFDGAGYDAALFIEADVWNNPYYHQQSDNFENPNNLNFDYAVKMVRSMVGWLVDAAGVDVRPDRLRFVYPDDRPEYVSPGGGTTIRVDVEGVGDETPVVDSGLLHFDVGSGWQALPMNVLSPNSYEAVIPASTCRSVVSYYFSAQGMSGEGYADPRTAPDDFFTAVSAYDVLVPFADDFETDTGWSVSGNASDGQWDRGVPVGGGDRGDPASDYDGSGACYLTDNVDDNSDVDGGYTYLDSPAIDLSEDDATIRFALWYTNNAGAAPNDDLFKVYVSNDGGSSWTLVETVGPVTSAGWTVHEFVVSDFVVPTANVRVRFEASDLGDGSVVEAGVDAFEVIQLVCDSPCPEDLNGDGVVDLSDLGILLAAYEVNDGGDIDGDGDTDLADLGALLALYDQPC